MEFSKKGVLLHVCCAPCLATALASIRGAGLFQEHGGVAGVLFYNPNIHPLLEFRRRVKALRLYLERDPLPAEIDDAYGLRDYLGCADWADSLRERCASCYRIRLRRAAECAKSLGLEGLTTTLLASREQDRDLVARIGAEAAEEAGIRFHTADLRSILPDEKFLRGIYKQQYCGCVFSEEERFRNTAKHLYFPGGRE